MAVYKLLDQNMESHGGCRWTLGEWKESEAVGGFCAPDGYHAYEHPLLAILHNPIHGDIQSPRLFVAEVEGEIIRDGQMKLKAQRMRMVQEIPVPSVTTSQRVAYAIFCAKAVCSDKEWDRWADGWLSGSDRSEKAAEAAAWTARAEAYDVAEAAAWAAWAAQAAEAGARAAEVALSAAYAAAQAGHTLNLIACAEKAMEVR